LEKQLIEEISDSVATLTFNRPDRLNALSTPIMEGLLEALPRLAQDAASRRRFACPSSRSKVVGPLSGRASSDSRFFGPSPAVAQDRHERP
jgi:hypothetical protein